MTFWNRLGSSQPGVRGRNCSRTAGRVTTPRSRDAGVCSGLLRALHSQASAALRGVVNTEQEDFCCGSVSRPNSARAELLSEKSVREVEARVLTSLGRAPFIPRSIARGCVDTHQNCPRALSTGAAPRARKEEACRHGPPGRESRDTRRLAAPGQSSARGLDPGRRAMRLRRPSWPSVAQPGSPESSLRPQ
jgi:hypothetical protein